jgi:hypothetical protein
MTLGGRRVQVSQPLMRAADDERELPVTTYEHFADRDPRLHSPAPGSRGAQTARLLSYRPAAEER